jgi:hypothetical protein
MLVSITPGPTGAIAVHAEVWPTATLLDLRTVAVEGGDDQAAAGGHGAAEARPPRERAGRRTTNSAPAPGPSL